MLKMHRLHGPVTDQVKVHMYQMDLDDEEAFLRILRATSLIHPVGGASSSNVCTYSAFVE